MKNFIKTLTLTPLLLLAACGCPDKCCDHNHGHGHVQATETEHKDMVIAVDSKETFDTHVLNATKPVIIDFHAPWCGACQVLKPIFHETAREQSNDYAFVSINVDNAKDLAESFGIQGIPALLFFKDGKEVETARHAGAVTKNELKAMIDKAFGK